MSIFQLETVCWDGMGVESGNQMKIRILYEIDELLDKIAKKIGQKLSFLGRFLSKKPCVWTSGHTDSLVFQAHF